MKKVMMIAAVIALAAGTAFGAESTTQSKTFHGTGTVVSASEKVSVDGQIRRMERAEEVTAGPGKGLKRWIYAEEAGRNGKMAIREVAADGRKAEAEGIYQRY